MIFSSDLRDKHTPTRHYFPSPSPLCSIVWSPVRIGKSLSFSDHPSPFLFQTPSPVRCHPPTLPIGPECLRRDRRCWRLRSSGLMCSKRPSPNGIFPVNFSLRGPHEPQLTSNVRLNDKLKARSLSIDDLVTDLSDGVCPTLCPAQ